MIEFLCCVYCKVKWKDPGLLVLNFIIIIITIYYLFIIMRHLNFLRNNHRISSPVLHNILEEQPYESQRLKWIPTRVRGLLLKNLAVRDSKTAIRQLRAALEPPPVTMEKTRR